MPTEIDRAIERADSVAEDIELPEPKKAKAGMKKATGREKFNPPFVPMTRHEVEEALRISRSKIYEMINPEHPRYDSSFPKPMRWGTNSVMWRDNEIEHWMLTRERTSAFDNDA